MKRKLLLATIILIVAFPFVATGHVRMMECTPEPDSTLTTSPDKVSITFLGSLERAFSKIEVFDEKGRKVSKKTTFREDDTIMEAELEKNLPPGIYTVKWKCMSIDGHTQKKEFKFTIK